MDAGSETGDERDPGSAGTDEATARPDPEEGATGPTSERGAASGETGNAAVGHSTDADPPGQGSRPAAARADDRERTPAVRRRDADEEGATGALVSSGPLEPEDIDTENAAFVLLGVLLVVGFLAVTVAGL